MLDGQGRSSLPDAIGQIGDKGLEALLQNAGLLEVIIHHRGMIEAAKCALQPKPIPAVQNADNIGLVALYKSTGNIVSRRSEGIIHDSHLHHEHRLVTLVAA